MNRIKGLSMAGIMILALANATFAGNIHTGVVTPPPPPPPLEESVATQPQNSTAPGNIHTGKASSDLGTEIILTLLQVLSVY